MSGSSHKHPICPPLVWHTLVTIILAGIVADVSWEIWARYITPFWVGGPLQPAALVQSVFGFRNLFWAEVIHAVVGVVFYHWVTFILPVRWLV